MHIADSPVTNDTPVHPRPGYILVEIFYEDKDGSIILPNHVRENRNTKYERIIVLEHVPYQGSSNPPYAPGTRIITKGGALINVVPNRMFSIVDEADVIGIYDK